MIYGKEYAKNSDLCKRCEAHSPSLEFRTCDSCGEQGCSFCIESRDHGRDRDTGYHDVEHLCQACADRKDFPADQAAEQKGDMMREERGVTRRRTPRRGPLRDKSYLAFIRMFPCVVCRYRLCSCHGNCNGQNDCVGVAVEAAHVGVRGLGQKCSDRETIPLCKSHHSTGKDAAHVLGKKFFTQHGLDRDKIIAELNRLYEVESGHR